jgi:ketosteroid isomerase-like protein
VDVEESFAVADHVVSCVRFRGHGRDSGVPVEVRETNVARFRDGKVVAVREYREKADALEAIRSAERP